MPTEGTPKQTIRVDPALWEAFGAVADNRAAVLRQFMRWYVGTPGVDYPKRPRVAVDGLVLDGQARLAAIKSVSLLRHTGELVRASDALAQWLRDEVGVGEEEVGHHRRAGLAALPDDPQGDPPDKRGRPPGRRAG